MKKFKNTLFYLVLIVTLVACGSDDNGDMQTDDMVEESDEKITALIDGESFESSDDEEAIRADLFQTSETNQFVIAGAQFSGNSAQVIGFSFAGFDIETLDGGAVFNGAPLDAIPFALGTYQEQEGENTIVNSSTEANQDITITITAVNQDENFISGEFNFVSTDESTGENFTVTNGVFTNINYAIQ